VKREMERNVETLSKMVCLLLLLLTSLLVAPLHLLLNIPPYPGYLLTSCLTFTLRSATVRESVYMFEKVFSMASAVTCVSGELKSAGNVLTGGQRVCWYVGNTPLAGHQVR
jgi:hypothetical protein